MAAFAVISAFIEGPAGSGKTHQLIERVSAESASLLTAQETKVLGLTFMNGARQRLSARLSEVPALRGRMACLTFDSLAKSIVHRRRSLAVTLSDAAALRELGPFDRTCALAALLLENPSVAGWFAASYPLLVVDEAQDLDVHRLRLLRALANACSVIAAADEFQNLDERRNAVPVMAWLRTATSVVPLEQIRRTQRRGLLGVAAALRRGERVEAQLRRTRNRLPVHVGEGIRIVEQHARGGLLPWAVADELSQMPDRSVILTPDMRGAAVQSVLTRLQAEPFYRNRARGQTFGPYRLQAEQTDDDRAAALIAAIPGEGPMSISEAIGVAEGFDAAEKEQICRRLTRARSLGGDRQLGRDEFREIIEAVLRDSSRFSSGRITERRVMTIQRAKNREFDAVVVLWPHTVVGSAEHQRRLLYNAVTRARLHCSIVIFGQNRMHRPPFSPGHD